MKKSSVIVAILMLVILAACSKGSDLIYFTSDRDGNMEIYSIDPDSGEELNITDNPEDEYSPVISPNREWLAFLVGNENKRKKKEKTARNETNELVFFIF